MSKSLQTILGYMPLTEALRATSSGVPNPFPQELFNVAPANRIMGDRAKYIRITGERRTAQFAKYGSPARRRSLRDISSQNVRMMHSFESFPIDLTVLQQLQSFEQYVQDEGVDWLSYQLEEAAKRQVNARIIATASTLRYGEIYIDTNGNLLPTSSGAAETYSFNVPSSHKDQINGVISASWALSSTDILGQLRNLRQYAAQETGIMPTTALYGVNVPSYIQNNDYALSYLSRNTSMNDKIMNSGEIPDGFGDIKRWIPVYTSFFEDADGTNQEIWNDDLVVFLPDLNQPDKMNWWAMYEGSFPIPRTLDVQRDPMQTIRNAETVYGNFSYGTLTINPVGAEIYHGDTFLPGLRNEKAIFMADVAF